MSPSNAHPDEMPEFSLSGRAGLELDEQLLDAILTGRNISPEAPGQATVVAEMLASLAVPAVSGHLAGEEAARSAFARAVSPAPARRASAWPGRPARLSVRLAAAAAAVVTGLSGTVAAYAGALPGPVQNLAHVTIGAPSPRPARPGHRHHPRPARSARTAAASSGPPATASPGRGHGRATGQGKGSAKSPGQAKGKNKNKANGKARGHSKLPPGQARKHGKKKLT